MTEPASGRTHVTSADGTHIAVSTVGAGRPLVICHGSLGRAQDWAPVADLLAPRMTVHTFDRRGRGGSGEGPDHGLAREQEDLAAVLDIAGPDAVLLGHSYGGVVSLALALEQPPAALAVYEPPVPVLVESWTEPLQRYEQALRDGDHDRAVEIGLREFVRMPQSGIEAMRGTPVWSALAALAPTWPREVRAIEDFGGALDRFASITSPVLFLAGEASPPWIVEASKHLARSTPDDRWADLPGQEHSAHLTAPDVLAEKILPFALEAGTR